MTGSSDFHKSQHRLGEVLPYPHDAQLPQELEHRDLSSAINSERSSSLAPAGHQRVRYQQHP